MKLSRTQLIAWYKGKPDVEGRCIIRVKEEIGDGVDTFIAEWNMKYNQGKGAWATGMFPIDWKHVLEWTPLP